MPDTLPQHTKQAVMVLSRQYRTKLTSRGLLPDCGFHNYSNQQGRAVLRPPAPDTWAPPAFTVSRTRRCGRVGSTPVLFDDTRRPFPFPEAQKSSLPRCTFGHFLKSDPVGPDARMGCEGLAVTGSHPPAWLGCRHRRSRRGCLLRPADECRHGGRQPPRRGHQQEADEDHRERLRWGGGWQAMGGAGPQEGVSRL